jgi:hypothetical protein
LKVWVDVAQVIGTDHAGRDGLEEEERSQPVFRQQAGDSVGYLHPVYRCKRMVIVTDTRNTNGVLAQELDEAAHEGRLKEWYVTRGQIGRVSPTAQGFESRQEALERSAPGHLVADYLDTGGQGWDVLSGSGDHHKRANRLAQQPDDAGQHRLSVERQPGFWPSHATALAPTQDNAADVHPVPLESLH